MTRSHGTAGDTWGQQEGCETWGTVVNECLNKLKVNGFLRLERRTFNNK